MARSRCGLPMCGGKNNGRRCCDPMSSPNFTNLSKFSYFPMHLI